MLIALDVWLFALGRAVMSFALGNTGLMMTTLAERVPNNTLGLAFTIMNSSAPLGYFVAPLIGGPLVDAYGLPALLLFNIGALLLVFIGISFGYKDTYRGMATGSLWKMAAESVTIIARLPGVRSMLFAIFALFLGWHGVDALHSAGGRRAQQRDGSRHCRRACGWAGRPRRDGYRTFGGCAGQALWAGTYCSLAR